MKSKIFQGIGKWKMTVPIDRNVKPFHNMG